MTVGESHRLAHWLDATMEGVFDASRVWAREHGGRLPARVFVSRSLFEQLEYLLGGPAGCLGFALDLEWHADAALAPGQMRFEGKADD